MDGKAEFRRFQAGEEEEERRGEKQLRPPSGLRSDQSKHSRSFFLCLAFFSHFPLPAILQPGILPTQATDPETLPSHGERMIFCALGGETQKK